MISLFHRLNCVHLFFEYLQGWRLHDFSGLSVPMFNHPHKKKKKKSVSLCSDGMSCVSICAFASWPVSGHHWFIFSTPCYQIFINIGETPLFPLQDKESQLFQPLLAWEMMNYPGSNYFSKLGITFLSVCIFTQLCTQVKDMISILPKAQGKDYVNVTKFIPNSPNV